MNLVYIDKIVAEIQLRYGSKAPFYYANHFLYEIARADSPAQIEQQVMFNIDRLVSDGRFDASPHFNSAHLNK